MLLLILMTVSCGELIVVACFLAHLLSGFYLFCFISWFILLVNVWFINIYYLLTGLHTYLLTFNKGFFIAKLLSGLFFSYSGFDKWSIFAFYGNNAVFCKLSLPFYTTVSVEFTVLT